MPGPNEKFSCNKCTAPDNDHMVMCDKCDNWYHYRCVGVDDSIADVSWACENCGSNTTAVGESNSVNSSPNTIEQLSPTGATTKTSSPITVATKDSYATTASHVALLTRPPLNAAPTHSNRGDPSFNECTLDAYGARTQHECLNNHKYAHIASNRQYSAVDHQQHVTYGCSQKLCTVKQPMFSDRRQLPLYSNANQSLFESASQQKILSSTSQPHQLSQPISTVTANCYQQRASTSNNNQPHMCTCESTHQLTSSAAEHIEDNGYAEQQRTMPAINYDSNQPYDFLHQDQNNNNHNLFRTSNYQQACPTPSQLAARHVIPKNLPSFDGNPEEWPLFISTFENSTALAGYSDAENLVRLQTCLKGRARDMVRSRLLVPSMVPEVIHTLQMCFGRSEVILDNLIEKVRKIPPVRERLDALIDLALGVRNICATIESCNLGPYLHNPVLVKEIVEKLPNQHKLNWAMYAKNNRVPILKQFSDWLYTLAEAASQVVSPQTSKRTGLVNAHYHAPVDSKEARDVSECVYCNTSGHRIGQCRAFESLPLDTKWDIVRERKLCRQCLNGHRRRCFSKKLCGVQGCTAKHHRLLHRSNEQVTQPNNETQSELMVNSHTLRELSQNFFRIVPVSLHNGDKKFNTYAFLDEGSSVTLIDKSVFDTLNLRGINDPLCLKWTGDQSRSEDSSMRTTVCLTNTYGGRNFTLRSVRTVEKLGLPSQTLRVAELTKRYHLAGLPIQGYENAKPTILIGSDNWNLAVPLKVKEGKWSEPIATKTRLGWAVQGGNSERVTNALNIHTCGCEAEYKQLHELVKEQFQLDQPAKATIMSNADQRAMDILDKTCKRVGERFEVGLLWREDDLALPDSTVVARKRFECLQNKFKRDRDLKVALQEKIDNLCAKAR